MLLRRSAPALTSAVTLEEAKQHCRIDHSDDDAMVTGYLAAAIGLVGEMSGRVMAPETWVASYDKLTDDLVLPKSPIIEVTEIAYFDVQDAAQTADLADFSVILDDDRTILRPKNGKYWPNTSKRPDAISITFDVGYQTIPDELRSAVLLIVGHLYENRGDTVQGFPPAVEHLVAAHRIGWVAA